MQHLPKTISRAPQCPERGFTLIELSIVLVIIGLIVGGVLVGQDLIKAAEMRSAITQMEKYNTAAMTFRNKYNGLPGDLIGAATFGLAATSADPATAGFGNGNALIENSGADANGGLGESLLFWTHLAQASLIEAGTTANTDYAAPGADITVSDDDLPPSRLGGGTRVHVTNVDGLNHFVLSAITTIAAADGVLTGGVSASPIQAFQLDTKLDDGNPETGIVISIADGAAPTAAGGGSATPATPSDGDDCYDSDAPAAYAQTTTALGNQRACQLRIRTSF